MRSYVSRRLFQVVIMSSIVLFGYSYSGQNAQKKRVVSSTSSMAPGVWVVRQCRPEKMASGYTMVYSAESNIVYWFHKGRLAHMMNTLEKIAVARQKEGGLYGIFDSRIVGYDSHGIIRFSFPQEDTRLPGWPHHDVIEGRNGIICTLLIDRVSKPDKEIPFDESKEILDDRIVAIDYRANRIVFDWSVNENLLGSRDAVKFLETRGNEHWIHSNSLDIFENGDILLSARNINQIVRISYPDGKIIWRKGDDVLSLQHHASIQKDGTILVYDNGWREKRTGIVRFSSSGELLMNKRLDFYSGVLGSVEELPNGNWLVVDGTGGRVLEYAPDLEEIVCEIQLLQKTYIPWASVKKKQHWVYRAHQVSVLPFGSEEHM